MLSFQRSFSINPVVLAAGHPYALSSSNPYCTIHFFEFRGIGPPSADFGHAGDVYVDLTPRLHALYWRERDTVRGVGAGQWRRWTGLLLDKVPLYKFLVPHPWARSAETSDLYLWVDPGGVTWTSKDNLCASRVQMVQRNIATVTPGIVPDVEELVSEVLHRMLDAERHATGGTRSSSSQKRSPISNATLTSPHIEKNFRGGHSLRAFPPPAANQPHTASGSHLRVQNLPQHPSFRPDNHTASFSPDGYGTRGPVYPNAMHQPSEQERYHAAQIALDGMRRAQNAELRSKQELKQKSRELAKLRQKEKEVIGMSYHYQKRERELVAALAAAQQRSSAELEEMRAAVRALKRQAEMAQHETQNAVAQVQSSQEELAATQREIQKLHSLLPPISKSADK
ncbi:hypothetical protein MVEN_00806000 [Mycena venus]|uniref:Uncharacterized protein n=1 Tax=Mycena venus TaxID=2733690 RepID=A0A8H6YM36_9AGAR|nr:hypothetical protein MVEN_00806000 [Mycena venus]